jgi:pimeloyl-ACP methyl ester carboxylesterase
VHPGGSGGSGVDFVRNAPPQARAAITRRYDLIGFDARGAGHSRPVLDCKVDQEHDGVYSQPFTRPETLDVGAARRPVPA